MSRKTIGETLKKAVAWPTKFLFGDDIFISYSRADGATYAAGLADELAGRKFSCRFDLWGTEPGKEMPNSLKRALKRSAVLVLVGSQSAAKSVHVAQEVAELKRRGRKIIPVAFDGVVLRNNITVRDGSLERIVATANSVNPDEALWAADIEGLPLSCEKVVALKTGDPSPDVISRIEKTFTFSRKDERLRKTTAAIGVVLIILIGASIVAGYVATKKGREAALRTSEAARAEIRARDSEQKAKQQEENAKQQTLRAETATLKATEAEKVAGEKTRLADEKTKLAAEKTKLATAATKRADEQTAKADAASKRAATQELSAHKNLARSYYAQAQAESNSLRALAWASTSVKEAPREDENKSSYMVRALDLASRAPLSVINSPTGLISASFSPAGETIITFSASGKFAVWDGYTGEPLPHPFPDPGFKYELDLTNFYKAVFSSDGSRAALLVREPAQAEGSMDLHLLVWEARTGRAVRDIKVEDRVQMPHTMSFSPDDQDILITVSREDIGYSVWDFASGKERIYETPIKKSRWAWDNKTSSIWSQNPARNWFLNVRDKEVIKASAGAQPISAEVLEVRDNLTGKLIAEHPLLDKEPHEREVAKDAAFTPDAQKIVLLSEFNADEKDSKYKGPQTLLRVWNVVTGRASAPRLLSKRDSGDYSEFGIEAGPWSISRDGKRLLITNSKYNFISVWDISGAEPDWKSTISIPEASNGVKLRLELAFFTEDDQNLISISLGEDNNRVINVWSAESYHLASQPFIIKYGSLGYDVSPRDKTVNVLHQDGTLVSWDLMRDGSFSTIAPDLPKTQDMAFEGAVLTPDRLSLLTIGYHQGAMNEHGPHVMQLWDAATGVKKWPADLPAPSTPDQVKFSSDGSRFFVMPKNREYYQVGIAVRRLSDGANLPGFRPITVPLDEVEFSRDGARLITEVWASPGRTIRAWSATTGESLPGNSVIPSGYPVGFTRFGEYYITLPPGFDANENYSEIILSKVNFQPNQQTRLRFADNSTAALAMALLRQAQKVEVTGENEVVAILDSGIRISIEQSPTGALLTNQATKLQLMPILDSQADLSQVILSPDGRMAAASFAAKKKTQARVWDLATGLPLSERLWGDSEIKDIAFTPDSTRLMIADKFGGLRSWFFQDFKGDAPPWMLSMSEALAGLRVVGGADIQRVSPVVYAKMRREFGEALAAAAASGDQRARFLLAGRKH